MDSFFNKGNAAKGKPAGSAVTGNKSVFAVIGVIAPILWPAPCVVDGSGDPNTLLQADNTASVLADKPHAKKVRRFIQNSW